MSPVLFCWPDVRPSGPPPVIDTGSSEPGGSVNRKGNPTNLLGNAISVGHPLPSVELVDSSMKHVDLSKKKGKVLLLSIVPSIDTKVCEEQTHYLGEEGDKLFSNIERITISRDTLICPPKICRRSNYLIFYICQTTGRGNLALQPVCWQRM